MAKSTSSLRSLDIVGARTTVGPAGNLIRRKYMKKLVLLLSLVAATTAAFAQATHNDTKTISLVVNSYVNVSIASGATITVTDGGQIGEYHAAPISYSVLCNVACTAASVVLNS